MKKIAVLLTLVSLQLAYAKVPVMISSGGEELDPCSLAQVRGLDSRGDGFLAVRNGPGGDYTQVDELYNGDKVWYCDEQGSWIGVVYGGDECGVASPVNPATPYSGNCRSGWVFKKFINVIAG